MFKILIKKYSFALASHPVQSCLQIPLQLPGAITGTAVLQKLCSTLASAFHGLRKCSSPTEPPMCCQGFIGKGNFSHSWANPRVCASGQTRPGSIYCAARAAWRPLLSCQWKRFSIRQKEEVFEGNQYIYSINHTHSREVQQYLYFQPGRLSSLQT